MRARVPRIFVIAFAAAILCVPAITALSYTYIRDSQNRVVHLHTGQYDIYNSINDTSGMQASAGYAINNWGNQLTNDDTVVVDGVTSATGAEVKFRDSDLPDSGAAVVWSMSYHQSTLPVDVVFDSSKEPTWSQNLKQHKACNVIGNLLGLADQSGSGDCMDPAGTAPTVDSAGVDTVDAFYGPNVDFANQLYDNRDNLDSAATYPLDVTASGHAIKSVTVTLDGNQIATNSITPCDGSCSVSVTRNVGPLSAGTHTIGAAAINDFGQSHLRPLTLTVAPDTAIDSGPNGPTKSAMPTFTYHSPTSGTTFQCKVDQASYATCPTTGYTPSAALADGSHTFYVRANSSGHTDPSPASQTFTVDTVRPTLDSLSGDFTDQTNPLVSAGPEEDVTASDVGTGVAQAVLKVDGTAVETITPDDGCASPCSIDDSFLPEISDLAAGSHNFQIIATDAAGNDSLPRSGSFVLDPTPPQIAVAGALADSSGGPLTSATAGASITATDNVAGDSGIASVEVTVDDETDRTYSQTCTSSCPPSVSANYTYSKAAWSPGPHLVAFTATDKAGNQQTTTLDVDEPSADPIATCPTPQPQQQTPGQTVTASGAVSQAIAPSLVAATTDPATDTTDPESPETLDPTLTASNDGSQSMESADTASVDEIAQGPNPPINVGDEICLVPTQTTSAETAQTEATMAGGDIQVYPNAATNTDTIVRPTVGGEDIIESIHGSSAPSSFSFAVGIPPGDQLQQLTGGGLAVVNPSQAAPADLNVPPDPHAGETPQQVTNDLPDAMVQFGEHGYSVASAEQETGHFVDAVLQPPETVDSLGRSTPTTITVSGSTITVQVPSAAKAVVMKAHSNTPPPDVAKAWYVTAPNGNLKTQLRGFACDFAHQSLGGNRLLIFNFNGVAQWGPHSFGTFNGHELHNGSITQGLKEAAAWYQRLPDPPNDPGCYRSGEATITYANANKHVMGSVDFGKAGRAQASVVSHLRYSEHNKGYKNEHARAAGDLESGQTTPAQALSLADGATTPGGGPYLDIGDPSLNNNWHRSDICDVSYKTNGSRLPMPEAYSKSEVKDWGDRFSFCRHSNGDSNYKFAGALTAKTIVSENGVHWQQAGFGSGQAWRSLRHQSNGHLDRELSDLRYP
jgi:hypothetical protein